WVRHIFLGVSAMVYLRHGSVLASCYDPNLGTYGIYKTTNNGDTWCNTNTFSGINVTTDFVLDTNDDIYVSIGGQNPGVYLSTNSGNSWLNYGLSGQIANSVTCIAVDSSGYVWAGAHQDGVYRTEGRTVPVELVSFSAEINGNNILLNWVTASEINNRGFEIQRLQNYKITELQDWVTVGFINGYGTTTETNHYSFIDENVTDGTYLYRIKQIDFDGTFEYSNVIEIDIGIPDKFFLSQNYPNPFNPETNIDYIIPEETLVNISLYDITGKKIKELVNEKKQPGYYTIKLKGGELSSGIYFYRLITGSGYSAVKKLTIVK